MPQRERPIDDDALPVMVPRNDKPLVPIPARRVQRLRDHLVRLSRTMKGSDTAAKMRAEPNGFAAQVVHTACSLCRGWCCSNGGDDGFLDQPAIARMHQSSDADAVVALYVGRVPELGYEGSCIFHGKHGCTLDRSMRSDVCNAYFCGGLQAFLTGGEPAAPTVVIAGEAGGMRTSPVVFPHQAKTRRLVAS